MSNLLPVLNPLSKNPSSCQNLASTPRSQILPIHGQAPSFSGTPTPLILAKNSSLTSLPNISPRYQSPTPIRMNPVRHKTPIELAEPLTPIKSPASNLISSKKSRQDERFKLPTFNINLNPSKPQRTGSESPSLSNSSLGIQDFKFASNHSPRIKFLVKPGEVQKLSSTRDPRNVSMFDQKTTREQNSTSFDRSPKSIYQQAAMQIIDTATVDQKKIRPQLIPRNPKTNPLMSSIIIQRNATEDNSHSKNSILEMIQPTQQQETSLNTSQQSQEKQEQPSPSSVRSSFFKKIDSIVTSPSIKLDSNTNTNQAGTIQFMPQLVESPKASQDSLTNSPKKQIIPLITSSIQKRFKLTVGETKTKLRLVASEDDQTHFFPLENSSQNNLESMETIRQVVPKLNLEGHDTPQAQRTSMFSFDKVNWVNLNPKLKNLRDENKPILRSRGQSGLTSRDSDRSSRRVTFVVETQPQNHTLRSMLWTFAFGRLLLNSVEKWAKVKKVHFAKEFLTSFQKNKEFLLEFAGVHLKESLLKIVKEKKSLCIVDQKVSLNDLNSRCLRVHDYAISFFEELLLGIHSDKLPQSFLQSFAYFFRHSAIIPNTFFSDFELKMLSFTHYGTLKNMNENRVKMILGGYVILRILLLEVIMRPWQVLQKTSSDKVNQRNLLNIGSVIYHAFLDILNSKMEIKKDNQSVVHPEDRVIAIKQLLQATDKQVDDGLSDDVHLALNNTDNQILRGFYPRSLLTEMIKDRSVLYQDIKDCLEDTLESLYKKVQAVHQANIIEYPQSFLVKTSQKENIEK